MRVKSSCPSVNGSWIELDIANASRKRKLQFASWGQKRGNFWAFLSSRKKFPEAASLRVRECEFDSHPSLIKRKLKKPKRKKQNKNKIERESSERRGLLGWARRRVFYAARRPPGLLRRPPPAARRVFYAARRPPGLLRCPLAARSSCPTWSSTFGFDWLLINCWASPERKYKHLLSLTCVKNSWLCPELVRLG